MKGSKIVRLDLVSEKPSDEALAELLIGPSGNLRAPAFTVKDTLVVGFNAEAYRELMGK